MRAGRESLLAGKYVDAAESLRIACFGMLDTPKTLSPCLAMLAVAQQGIGRTADVESTLSRFVEVEQRFPSWSTAQIDASLRTDFESLLRKRIPAETIASLPAFRPAQQQVATRTAPPVTQSAPPEVAAVAPKTEKPAPAVTQPATQPVQQKPAEPARTAEPAPAKPAPAQQATAPASSTAPQQTTTTASKPASTPVKEVVLPMPKVEKAPATSQQQVAKNEPAKPATQPATKPVESKPAVPATTAQKQAETKPSVTQQQPASASASTSTPPPPPPAQTIRVGVDPVGDARKLISDRKPAEASRLLAQAVAQSPGRRDYRLALLQAAVFASDWKTALAQVEPLKPFRDAEAAYAFYGAVALYESGRRADAKALLSPVVARLAHSSYVDGYIDKIMK